MWQTKRKNDEKTKQAPCRCEVGQNAYTKYHWVAMKGISAKISFGKLIMAELSYYVCVCVCVSGNGGDLAG